MIYDGALTAVLPPSLTRARTPLCSQSQPKHSTLPARADCGPYAVLLLALLSLVLIYLIDYEPNPCTIPDNMSYSFFVFTIRRHLKAKDSINSFLGRFELSPVPSDCP